MSHKKFGPDRFSRFDVYWIQTNKQTNKQTNRQAKFIYRWYPKFMFGKNSIYFLFQVIVYCLKKEGRRGGGGIENNKPLILKSKVTFKVGTHHVIFYNGNSRSLALLSILIWWGSARHMLSNVSYLMWFLRYLRKEEYLHLVFFRLKQWFYIYPIVYMACPHCG